MTNIEEELSFVGEASATFAIAYLMSDELFNAIEFGDITTSTHPISSKFSNFVILNTTPISEVIIENNGPLTLILNPSALNLPGKINRISYEFSDGTKVVNSFSYQPTSIDTMNLPYPEEPGDPRNKKVTKQYFSSSYFSETFTILIYIYQYGKPDPIGILYNVIIKSPEMDGLGDGYFEEMHLVSTRMFGLNNNILYIFETKNPDYVVPVFLNWEQAPQSKIAQSNVVRNIPRPYRILEPYEIEEYNQNANIKIITAVQSQNPNVDDGKHQTFRMLNGQPISSLYPYLSGYLMTQNGKYLRVGDYYNSNLNK
jgi:hypothetical protein